MTTTTDTRPDIPLGRTRDAHGRELTFKRSDGYWREFTYDAQGNVLTYTRSNGDWYEYTRDAHGNELTFKNSTDHWHEYTRDAHGNELTYKDSFGVSRGFRQPEISFTQGVVAPLEFVKTHDFGINEPEQPKKTLRDEFAMAALSGLLACADTSGTDQDFAERAYEYADEMMKARTK